MKKYVQFLNKDQNNELVDATGSDGVFILDGRNSLNVQISDALKRLNSLRFVKPNYIGFQIQAGNFKYSKCIYRFIKPGTDVIINDNNQWLSK